MKNIVLAGLIAGLIAGAPSLATAANLIPYEAQYSVTAGAGDRAPQIGTARQKLGDGCLRTSFERDVNVALSLTQTLRYDVKSILRATESKNGRVFDYTLDRTMNGEQSQRSGKIAGTTIGSSALVTSPNGAKIFNVPVGTLLPHRMVEAILDHLQRGETQFAVQAFDAEVVSNLVEVSVQRVGAQDIAPRPQDAAVVAGIGAPAYPLQVTFSRVNGKPLFTAGILLHGNGVISRLIASFGPFTVAANLTGFTPLPQLRCAPPIRADQ